MLRRGAAAALAGGLLLAGGCASSAPPAAEAAEAEESASTASPALPVRPLPAGDGEAATGARGEAPGEGGGEAPVEGAAAAPSAAAAEPVRRQIIVIDEGGGEARPEPGELARATRREAAASGGGAPRVTNDNLADYARRGRVTVSGTPAPTAGETAREETTGGGEAAPASAGEPVRDEAWWRARARAVREEWRRTVDEIAELERTTADLRWRFYAEDDPWVRDRRVKPEWDRALDRLSDARRRLADYPRQLEELIEEGRREGALPGWLREGIELEPRAEELPAAQPDPAEPVEPRQVDQDQRGRTP